MKVGPVSTDPRPLRVLALFSLQVAFPGAAQSLVKSGYCHFRWTPVISMTRRVLAVGGFLSVCFARVEREIEKNTEEMRCAKLGSPSALRPALELGSRLPVTYRLLLTSPQLLVPLEQHLLPYPSPYVT